MFSDRIGQAIALLQIEWLASAKRRLSRATCDAGCNAAFTWVETPRLMNPMKLSQGKQSMFDHHDRA
jgi:hypothetical protein